MTGIRQRLKSFHRLHRSAVAALLADERVDSSDLLEVVEETRQRIGLDPTDPAAEQLLALLEPTEDNDAHDDKSRLLAEKLREKDAELRCLRGELGTVRSELSRRGRQEMHPDKPESIQAAAPATPGRDEAAREEIKRLHAERNALARELRQMRLGKTKEHVVHEQVATLAAAEDAGCEPVELGVQPVRIPCFTDTFIKNLARLPKNVSARVMKVCGALAAGEAAEFRSVKRLRRRDEYFRARMGDYRILFRMGKDSLDILDVLHRQDFDRWVAALD